MLGEAKFIVLNYMERLLKCDHFLEQCFTVVLFVFQLYPVCNFEKFDNGGYGII